MDSYLEHSLQAIQEAFSQLGHLAASPALRKTGGKSAYFMLSLGDITMRHNLSPAYGLQ